MSAPHQNSVKANDYTASIHSIFSEETSELGDERQEPSHTSTIVLEYTLPPTTSVEVPIEYEDRPYIHCPLPVRISSNHAPMDSLLYPSTKSTTIGIDF